MNCAYHVYVGVVLLSKHLFRRFCLPLPFWVVAIVFFFNFCLLVYRKRISLFRPFLFSLVTMFTCPSLYWINGVSIIRLPILGSFKLNIKSCVSAVVEHAAHPSSWREWRGPTPMDISANMKPRSCHILDTLAITLAVTTVGSSRLYTALQMASAARRVDTPLQGKGRLVVGSTAKGRTANRLCLAGALETTRKASLRFVK